MKRASILFLAVLFVVSCSVAANAGIFNRVGAGPCDPCATVPPCEPCADVPVCEPCADPCDPCGTGCGRVGGLLDRVRGIELNLGSRLGGLCATPCDPCADVPVCEEVVVEVAPCEPVCGPCDPCSGPRLRGRLQGLNLNLGGRLAGLGACDPCGEVPVCEEVVVEACEPVAVCDPCGTCCGSAPLKGLMTRVRGINIDLNLGGRLGACAPCGVEPCEPCVEVPVCEPCM